MGDNRLNVKKNIHLSHSMSLMYVGKSYCGDDWISMPHTHSCSEIFYCVRGVGSFVIEKEKHAVGGGDLIIINSNVEHTEISTSTNPLEFIAIGISGANFTFTENEKDWQALNFNNSNENILAYFEALLHELSYCGIDYEELCAKLVDIILLKIKRQSNFELNPIKDMNISKECALVKRYIDLHYREALSLTELAEIVHINKYYLSHTFNKSFNITPINYMIKLRLEESKHMLKKTNYSISAISQKLGFSSPSYFAQCFKKNIGVSPNTYRSDEK